MQENLKKVIELLYKLENNESFNGVYISAKYLNSVIANLENSNRIIKDQETEVIGSFDKNGDLI